MAERAAAALGLEVAGVEFISPDIARSYREVGGAIVGVDAAPRDLAGPVIDGLFPPGSPSSILLAAITGARGKTTTARMLGHTLELAGHAVGMATSDGVYIDGKLTVLGDMTGPKASELVLRDPTVDAAVLETAQSGIAHSGLGWRRCTVGAVLNLSPQGELDARLDESAQTLRVVVEVPQDFSVLNADDKQVAAMADHGPGEPVWVTLNPGNQLVKRHVRSGGRAVTLEPGLNGRLLVHYQGDERHSLLWARQIPVALGGKVGHNIQNAMFAAAIALGLGVEIETVRQGLRTFQMDFASQATSRLAANRTSAIG
jgi:cyanophycin synthetase